MDKLELEAFFKAHGWAVDRGGHLFKVNGAVRLRIKFTKLAVRIEKRIVTETNLGYTIDRKFEWIRIGGDYLSRVIKLDDGRVRVGSYLFEAVKHAPSN